MMDQIPDMAPGDHWGFSGDLIWTAAPEVGIWRKYRVKIPYYPNLSPYMG